MHTLINSDLDLPDPPVQKKKKKAPAKQKPYQRLKEIYGQKGEGLFDWQTLAQKIQVPLTLIDLFQVSPDKAQAFKHLSTKVTERKPRQDKGKERADPLPQDTRTALLYAFSAGVKDLDCS